CSCICGLSRLSTVPAGSFENAALVGANTVKGPAPSSVSTRPAAFTAATSVVWSFEFTAFWTMFFDGYIGAPPTVTVFSDIWASSGAGAAIAAKAKMAALAKRAKRLDMEVSDGLKVAGGDTAGDARPSRRRSEIRRPFRGVSARLSRMREHGAFLGPRRGV